MGHTETAGIRRQAAVLRRQCRRCGQPLLLTGDDLLPEQMWRAVHEEEDGGGGSETCAGTGELAAPIDPDMLSRP